MGKWQKVVFSIVWRGSGKQCNQKCDKDQQQGHLLLGVSKNRGGPPKSSILIGFSIINHPFWGFLPIFGNTLIYHTPVMTHVAGSDRLGPRVEEVWVWKLMIGSGWLQLTSCNYWILYADYKFIYVLFH